MGRTRQAGLVVLRTWWALRSQKRRRNARGGGEQAPLPVLAHHPGGGVPRAPLHDDIYLAENPGVLVSDRVELWVLDPNVMTILGFPPTEADWAAAVMEFLTYNEALGRWHYESAGVGSTKNDGDTAWVRGRFVRVGQAPGPWSVVDVDSGAGMAGWSL